MSEVEIDQLVNIFRVCCVIFCCVQVFFVRHWGDNPTRGNLLLSGTTFFGLSLGWGGIAACVV